ncbi:MAG: energy transducer TonB [Bergeyella sp.]
MKHLLKNTEFQLDEILFQGRNKEYGAYVLRSESELILTKALFAGVALFGAVALTPFILNAFKTDSGIATPPPVVVELSDVEKFTETVKPPEIAVPPKQDVKIVDTRVPEPVRDAKIQTPPATIDDSKDAVRGFENKDGIPPVVEYTPPQLSTGGTNVKTPPTEKVEPVSNEPFVNPEVSADFQGGINAFRNKMMQNFDTSGFEGSGDKITTTVVFIVERDGTISGVKADGADAYFNREAERTIKKIKGKWNPAKVNGQPVRSYFRFPVSMKFE